MNGREGDNPGVIARPPLIYLAFLLVGLALGCVWPVAFVPDSVRFRAGIALILLGVGIQAIALRRFQVAGTSHETAKPATALVTGGVFRYSRNPVYVSLDLIYAGIAVAAESLWMLVLTVPLHFVIHYGVVIREERYLEGKFGEEYARYKAAVRRWL
ncbi:MAG: methyltransferase family protein [Nitrospinota bacterium]